MPPLVNLSSYDTYTTFLTVYLGMSTFLNIESMVLRKLSLVLLDYRSNISNIYVLMKYTAPTHLSSKYITK